VSALIITEAGTCECLYTENIDLSTLGALTVKRATDIAFDNDSQEWKVRDMSGLALFGNCSREICLEWERDYLEQRETNKHGGEA
jgi:hypothetical protein